MPPFPVPFTPFRSRTIRSRVPLAFTFLLALVACGDDPTTPGGQPGITFLAGANVSDTVDATPVQAVRVQVRGSDGRVAPEQVVRVEAIRIESFFHEMLAANLDSPSFGSAIVDTTDEEGVIHFRVRMGQKAGTGRLIVTVPALGMQDTARFEVLPGAPAYFEDAPLDHVVTIGATLALDMGVGDRYGNPRTDAVTYSVASGGASVSGREVTGTAFGDATLRMSAGSLAGETIVHVVPVGSVALNVRPANGSQTSAIYTVNLDGSDLTRVATTEAGQGAGGWMTPAWLSPTRLIYSDEAREYPRPLYLLDLTTGESTRFLSPEHQMEIEHHPRVSHNREWVFFSGGTHLGYWLYRIRTNGEAFQRISPDTDELSHWTPAPSPDGSKVAYARQGAWEGGFEVMDVSTGNVLHIPVNGEHPRWSPDGSQIAYVSGWGELRAVNPDGTGDRSLSSVAERASGAIGWSPDGAYVVAESNGGQLTIVEAATGKSVSVRIPGIEGYMSSPAWRPEAP